MSTAVRIIVVGSGVIGRSIAWRAAAAGHDVRVVDPHPGSGASGVAGGMLAPLTEAWPGEDALLDLGAASLERWPDFAAALPGCGFSTTGTVVAAVDSADADELDALAAHLARTGREVERLDGRALRAVEPTLGPAVRAGLSVPGDHSVDNRRLLAALHAAAERLGVQVEHATATAVTSGLVHLEDGRTLDADEVVLAAGAHSADLHPALERLIRPVKGEILRLRTRRTSLPVPRHTVRGLVEGVPVYCVPRQDGGLVLGATQYEAGFDPDPTVAGVRDLLWAGERILPGIADYALVETAAGFRPAAPDNLPVIDRFEPGVLVATGHYRGGILLAPLTAEAVLALIEDREPPAVVSAHARLDRFVAQEAL